MMSRAHILKARPRQTRWRGAATRGIIGLICKQVCIALVVTFDGFPLGYAVFAGNTHDSRTLQTIVATMEARHGMLGRAWISDRGMASTDNLAWLRNTGRRYIIGAPKSELKKFSSALAAATDGARSMKASRSNSRAIPRPRKP
jgi:hypothetical protein